MPAIADVKVSSLISPTHLTTSATVGVDKTFSPEGFILPGVAKWVDRSGGIQIGYPALTLSVRAPTKQSRVTRVQAKLVVPTLEVTSPSTMTGIQPAPTKAYDCTANLEIMLPERSTLAERNALLSYLVSLLATTITASDAAPSDATGSPLVPAIQNMEGVY
jgi:hypothetical protein